MTIEQTAFDAKATTEYGELRLAAERIGKSVQELVSLVHRFEVRDGGSAGALANSMEVAVEGLRLAALKVHHNARAKGFVPDDIRQIPTAVVLIMTELAEIVEADRSNTLTLRCDKPGLDLTNLEEECADVLIRVLDFIYERGLDAGRIFALKHQYNTTRSYKHGGKRY